MTEPCDLSAVAARALIGQRKLSPVELTDSCIRRIEVVDPAVNAVVARSFETARKSAREREAAVMRGDTLGAVHGLPLGVKDLIDAEGLPTSFGSVLFADNVASQDEAIVAMLKREGAIVIGKTNVPEWGAGGNTRNAVYGATGNPFDPNRSAAGSSGGSAVALATGMVPLATGSDTGGSVRNPASFCGVVGFRPSPGLIASNSRNMAWLQISQLGPMARTVSDACLMLSCMLDRDARDPLSAILHAGGAPSPVLYRNPLRVDLSALRIAATTDFGFAPTEGAVARAFAQKLTSFETVFRGVEWTHPDCTGADEVFSILRAVAFLGRHRELVEKFPDKVGPNVRDNVAEGVGYSAADVARALSMQTDLYRRWQTFFADHDFILAPAVTISPRPWSELYPAEIDGRPTKSYFHWLALAYAVTNVGHPTVAIPAGRDEAGLPFGIQVIGPRGGDLLTLAVAREIEAVLAANPDTARPVPDIAWLAKQPPIAGKPGFLAFD
ncbi:amidase [Bradyrhizobium yuanmingense]|uniref:amidase n=1 Tax=Bradyrhizobium yuanmingense TaxID=108015 RepID=UPI0023B9E211|nr:amidase family protein [Bradyrhizobium yuanmingense]MDF0583357.1 amidase family protein [Bradyrhizobium yuanmingense]